MPIESALVVIIPEAEDLVSSFRDRYDPAAAAGVPAHVTITYPFKPPSELTAPVIDKLRQLLASFSSFDLRFEGTERFPRVLYLRPDPAEPLNRLIMLVTECFPEAPPYGGVFADVVPHLTIAHAGDSEQLAVISADFDRHARGRLPIESTVSEIVLMDNQSGHWQVHQRFALARR
jgi:2'-5' RNA ligase